MRLRYVLIAMAVVVLLSLPAMARAKGGHRLARLDKNHDGVISRDEFPGKDKAFNRLDTNHDGIISPEELKAAHAAHHKDGREKIEQRFKSMDANRDGRISRDEWKGKPKKFQKLDSNGDGFLTPDELKAHQRYRN